MHEVGGTFVGMLDACPASSRSGPKNWFDALPSGTLVPPAAEGETPSVGAGHQLHSQRRNEAAVFLC